MTKDELKPQVEEMLYQLLKLVQQLDEKESYELKIELACSVIGSAVDFYEYDKAKTINNIKDTINDVVDNIFIGFAEIIFGDSKEYREL